MEERAGCFTVIVFLMSSECECSVALPHNAIGWSVVCDYVNNWSCSLFDQEIFKASL